MALFTTSPDPPPLFITASISSAVASGFTICTCRRTFFLISVLNFCCALVYSFETSTNLRVSVLTRFLRILISEGFDVVEVSRTSVSSVNRCNSCFTIPTFLFVAAVSPCISWLISFSCSPVVARVFYKGKIILNTLDHTCIIYLFSSFVYPHLLAQVPDTLRRVADDDNILFHDLNGRKKFSHIFLLFNKTALICQFTL